jgi:hypothetical protein
MKYTWLILIGVLISSSLFAQTYSDEVFLQDYADKYELSDNLMMTELIQVRSDRNNVISIISSEGLLQPFEKNLAKDMYYRAHEDMNILGIDSYENQFVYLTDEAVFSNAWAGKFYVEHGLKNPTEFVMSENFITLVASKGELVLLQDGKISLKESMNNFEPKELIFDEKGNRFLILFDKGIYELKIPTKEFSKVYDGEKLTSFSIKDEEIILGTANGILTLDGKTFKAGEVDQKLPCTDITAVRNIDGNLWFGSKKGAFKLRKDGKYDYYASQRWLVDNEVKDLSKGPENSVLVLTKNGLSKINFVPITLADKADHFQKIQRLRHIRYGLTANPSFASPGDISTGRYSDTDNDGLWTSMYLAAELFRYAVTKSEDAKLNAYDAFEGMERLTDMTGLKGFPARSFARDGYEQGLGSNGFSEEWRIEWVKKNGRIWRPTEDKRWRWKSSTSSDESCGHFFVYALFAELAPDKAWRDRAIRQIKIQMDHIIENDWYLVDWNGKPTAWGRWNPEYVNKFPINVGDRRLNSTLILAFLQTAYHFTKDELYKEKAFELINEHGYDDNANRPATIIGYVEGEDLSDKWNHSDDRMYFLTIPAFVNYSFSEEQRQKHFESARSHWEIERVEKNPLWNFLYAMIGGSDYDLDSSIWWLKEYPMDLIRWTADNNERKDITKLEPNFRSQEFAEILPPDEINRGGGGLSESSPSDFLLPYWTGRYLKIITDKAN